MFNVRNECDTNCNWCTPYNHPRIGKKELEELKIRTCGDHPNDGTVKIGQNTEKSLGDMRKFAVT